VANASWSRCAGEDCVRVVGVHDGAEIRVRAGTPRAIGEFQPMAGRIVRDGRDVCFVPRFAFVDGTAYTVTVDGGVAAVLERARPTRAPTTEVIAIWPTARVVPRNLLRMYVQFSSRMSEGYATQHVRLVDGDGATMAAALLPTEHELWDANRRRLTVLLDPARIKRGLAPHREIGYPLQIGSPFRIIVDAGFRDARGDPLRVPGERCYEVGEDERAHVDPKRWVVSAPGRGTREPLEVGFGRPLDHALVARCLWVDGADGAPVAGAVTIGPEERSWSLVPDAPWRDGVHRLVVDAVLEDSAGNSVGRVFDRDLANLGDRPRANAPVELAFHPR
jgi:hypothetical protein